jgi:predicted RNA-binding Zn-ribbon protein involved in translation (DUF1610 family)
MTISQEKLHDAAERTFYGTESVGFCVACEIEVQIEPDAFKVECEACGNNTVYGIEEMLSCL